MKERRGVYLQDEVVQRLTDLGVLAVEGIGEVVGPADGKKRARSRVSFLIQYTGALPHTGRLRRDAYMA